ncbi:MAG: hypothetical protein KF767_09650 [Bdellovibrionaceae bacterium]|nr:hypothetical protein [Pseudobdellovibrionaceae bacterium]
MTRLLLATILLGATPVYGQTRATGVDPVTPEQQTTHDQVELHQKKLKKELKRDAPPEAIGRAKADVQKARVEANRQDMNQAMDSQTE